MMACRYADHDSSCETVKLLLEHGADSNCTHNKYTPLMLSIASENLKCVTLLCENGADPLIIKCIDGSALQQSLFCSSRHITKYLLMCNYIYDLRYLETIKKYMSMCEPIKDCYEYNIRRINRIDAFRTNLWNHPTDLIIY